MCLSATLSDTRNENQVREGDSVMRSWNYRVISRKLDDEHEYGIHEVYYGEGGTIEAWSDSRIHPHGYTFEELRDDLTAMGEALDKPVLDAADLPGGWSERPAGRR